MRGYPWPMDTPYRWNPWNPWWIGPWMWPLIPSWHFFVVRIDWRNNKSPNSASKIPTPKQPKSDVQDVNAMFDDVIGVTKKEASPELHAAHATRHGNDKIWSAVAQSMHRLGLHVSILSTVFVCLSIHKLAQTISTLVGEICQVPIVYHLFLAKFPSFPQLFPQRKHHLLVLLSLFKHSGRWSPSGSNPAIWRSQAGWNTM